MRPTTDRLETIMKDAHLRADDAGVLAAEVRALRQELAAENKGGFSMSAEIERLEAELKLARPLFSRRQLEAKLARVEALPAKWRGKKPRGTGTMTTGEVAVVQYAFQDAAEDLEAALKGSP